MGNRNVLNAFVKDTRDRIEAIREDSRKLGFDEGRKAGFAEGRKAGLAEASRMIQTLQPQTPSCVTMPAGSCKSDARKLRPVDRKTLTTAEKVGEAQRNLWASYTPAQRRARINACLKGRMKKSKSQKLSDAAKRMWASYTPAQRAARIKKMFGR